MKYLYLLALVILLYNCKNTKTTNIEYGATFDSISMNPLVDSLLDDYIKGENLTETQFDIYLISYLSDNNRVVTFISTNQGHVYLRNQRPLIYLRKGTRNIFVITGSEVLFSIKLKDKLLSNNIPGKYWASRSYILKEDTVITIQQGIPPFSPPPEDVIVKTK